MSSSLLLLSCFSNQRFVNSTTSPSSAPSTPLVIRRRNMFLHSLLSITLLFMLVSVTTAAAPATIINVSPSSGSIRGSTRLTIRGTNFNDDPTANLVQLGNEVHVASCNVVEDASTDDQLVCLTEKMVEGRGEFLLTVQPTAGVFAECVVEGGCAFTYTFDKTAVVSKIIPERLEDSSNDGDTVRFHGSRFSIQDRAPTAVDFNVQFGTGAKSDRCQVKNDAFYGHRFDCSTKGELTQPGVRAVHVGMANGDAARLHNDDAPLTVSVVPTITAIYPTTGSIGGGQRVTISGSGFSNQVGQNEVVLHGTSCRVVEASATALECITSAHEDTTNQVEGDEEELVMGALTADHWTGLSGGSIETELIARELYTSPQMKKVIPASFSQSETLHFKLCKHGDCATRFTGYFIPTVSGEHVFKLRSRGAAEVWFNEDSDVELPYERDAEAENGFNDHRICYTSRTVHHYPWSSQTSKPLQLEAGKRYWFRAFVKDNYLPTVTLTATIPINATHSKTVSNDLAKWFSTAPQSNAAATLVKGISVVSAGLNAICGKKCLKSKPTFNFVGESTPVVSAVTPSTAAAGDILTITGQNLMLSAVTSPPTTTGHEFHQQSNGQNKKPPQVSIGDSSCDIDVDASTDTVVYCTVSSSSRGGSGQLKVSYPDFGDAIQTSGGDVTLAITVTSISPNSGTVAGGTTVTIFGSGFGTDATKLVATVCGSKCDVTAAASTSLTCETTAASTALSSCDVHVSISSVSVTTFEVTETQQTTTQTAEKRYIVTSLLDSSELAFRNAFIMSGFGQSRAQFYPDGWNFWTAKEEGAHGSQLTWTPYSECHQSMNMFASSCGAVERTGDLQSSESCWKFHPPADADIHATRLEYTFSSSFAGRVRVAVQLASAFACSSTEYTTSDGVRATVHVNRGLTTVATYELDGLPCFDQPHLQYIDVPSHTITVGSTLQIDLHRKGNTNFDATIVNAMIEASCTDACEVHTGQSVMDPLTGATINPCQGYVQQCQHSTVPTFTTGCLPANQAIPVPFPAPVVVTAALEPSETTTDNSGSCSWTCASKCARCVSLTTESDGSKTAKIDMSSCKGSQVSWLCGRDATRMSACDGGAEDNKCNSVLEASYNVPAGQAMLTVQYHDGKLAGDVDCQAEPRRCCGGAGTSCGGVVSGVCDQVIDLSTCGTTPAPTSTATDAPSPSPTASPTAPAPPTTPKEEQEQEEASLLDNDDISIKKCAIVGESTGSIFGERVLEGFIATTAVLQKAEQLTIQLQALNDPFEFVLCTVFYVFDKKFMCNLPPHVPATVRVVAIVNTETHNSRVYEIGTYTYAERLRWVQRGAFGPRGGNLAYIHYDSWHPLRESQIEISVGGVPCIKTDIEYSDSRITCWAASTLNTAGSTPTTISSEPLQCYNFASNSAKANKAYAEQFITNKAQFTKNFIVVPPQGMVMTKQHFSGPIAVTAVIQPSKGSNGEKNCIRMRVFGDDASSTNTGYEAYMGEGDANKMGLRVGGHAAGGVPEFDETVGTGAIGLSVSKTLTMRLEVHETEIFFYVDDHLVESRQTTSFSSGPIGFINGCQNFKILSLCVDSLASQGVVLKVDGTVIPSNGQDIIHNDNKHIFTYISEMSICSNDKITFAVGGQGGLPRDSHLQVYLFPPAAEGNQEWDANYNPSLCSSIDFDSKNDVYRCTVRGHLPGGSFTLRLRSYHGGFAAGSFNVSIVPRIDLVTPNEIVVGRKAYVQLRGSGFPPTGTTIAVGGEVCTIVSSSYVTMLCTVTPLVTSSAALVEMSSGDVAAKCATTSGTCAVLVSQKKPFCTHVDGNTNTITITHVRQQFSIFGTDLSRYHGRAFIGNQQVEVVWGSDTQMLLEIPPSFTAIDGSIHILTAFSEFGEVQFNNTITVTVQIGTVVKASPKSCAAGAAIRLTSLGLNPTSTMTPLFTGSSPPVFDAIPHHRVQQCSGHPIVGFFAHNDLVTKSLASLPASHVALGIKLDITLNDGWYHLPFFVTVDGVEHRFDRQNFHQIPQRCSFSYYDDYAFPLELVVPHTALNATISFRGTSSWGYREGSFQVFTSAAFPYDGTLPSVNGTACPVVSMRRNEIHCKKPSVTSVGNGDITFNGKTCTACMEDETTTSSAPSIAGGFLDAMPSLLGAYPQFITRGSAHTTPTKMGVFRPSVKGVGDGWDKATASSVEQFTNTTFRSVSFKFDGSPRCITNFGLTSTQDTATGYSEITFGVYVNQDRYIRLIESGRYVAFLGVADEDAEFEISCGDTSCSFMQYFMSGRLVHVSCQAVQFPLQVAGTFYREECGVKHVQVATTPSFVAPKGLHLHGCNLKKHNRDIVTVVINGTHHRPSFVGTSYVVVPVAATTKLPLAISLSNENGDSQVAVIHTNTPIFRHVLRSDGSANGDTLQVVTGAGLAHATLPNCLVLRQSQTELECTTTNAVGSGPIVITNTQTSSAIAHISSICSGGSGGQAPSFTPDDVAVAPALNQITISSAAVRTLVVTGTQFVVGKFAKLIVGAAECVSDSKCSSTTEFQCTFSAKNILVGGIYSNVRVIFDGVGSTNSITVTVPVTVETPSTTIQMGTTGRFTCIGSGFGSTKSSSSLNIVDASGNTNVCSSIERVGKKGQRIVCHVSLGTTDPVEPFQLQVTPTATGGAPVTLPLPFVTISVAIFTTLTSVSPLVAAGGDILVFQGLNMGALSSLRVGSTPCVLVARTATTCQCRIDGPLPAGAHQITGGPSTVDASQLPAITSKFQVLRTSPRRANAFLTSNVTVFCSGLDHNANTYFCRIGGNTNCVVVATNATSITCMCSMPQPIRYRRGTDNNGVNVGLIVGVEGSGATAIGSGAFSYINAVAATVTAIYPASGPASGGTVVTLTGSNFHHNFQFNHIFIGGRRCLCESVSPDLTQVICVTSPTIVNPAAPVSVSILKMGKASMPTPLFFEFYLSVATITPPLGSVEGGQQITVNGNGFIEGHKPIVVIGRGPCRVQEVLSTTQLTCLTPPAPREELPRSTCRANSLKTEYPRRRAVVLPIQVRFNGIAAEAATKLDFKYINAASADEAVKGATVIQVFPEDISDGDIITIHGSDFAASGNEVSLTRRGVSTSCTVVVEDETSIACRVNTAAETGNFAVSVTTPSSGVAEPVIQCPENHFLTCDGLCLNNTQCAIRRWGRFGCNDIAELVLGDTFCHANGGTDKVGVPLTLDNGLPFNLNCPMYNCECNDCETSVGGVKVSTCGADPKKVVRIGASVSSFTPSISGAAGGQRVTLTGHGFSSTNTEVFFVPNSDGSTLVDFTTAVSANLHANYAANLKTKSFAKCDVLPEETTSTSLVCVTNAASMNTTVIAHFLMVVKVGSTFASCEQCLTTNFTYSLAITPAISSLTVESYTTGGMSLLIAGIGFDSANTTLHNYTCGLSTIGLVKGDHDAQEMIATCDITECTNNMIRCLITDSSLATVGGRKKLYRVVVITFSVGYASYLSESVTGVKIVPALSLVSPSHVSTTGGSILTLTGYGFHVGVIVRFGSCGCKTLSTSPMEIIVETQQGSCVGSHAPVLVQDDETFATTDAEFLVAFTAAATPEVTDASVSNSVCQLSGNFLTANSSQVLVKFGSQLCTITSFSTSSLTCTVPTLAAGTHSSAVQVLHVGHVSATSPKCTLSVGLTISSISPTTGFVGGFQLITITGSGFGTDVSFIRTISVAGIACNVETCTDSQITCLTGPAPLQNGQPAPLNGTVSLTLKNWQSASAADVYSYVHGATISSVEPSRGSTAGGTLLTISGTGLTTSQTVTISGVICTQSVHEQSMTNAAGGTKLYCTTGAFPTDSKRAVAANECAAYTTPVAVIIANLLNGAASPDSISVDQYQYIDLWSRRTTWNYEAPPSYMQSVVISDGQTVMLDVSPPRLHLLLIFQGHLIFDWTQPDLTLEATYIMVNYGCLTVGTTEKPFHNKATIRLFGDRLTPEIPTGGAKVLMMRRGKVNINGVKRQPTWTRLADHAVNGWSQITVQGAVDWTQGEEIVIAATDFEMNHAERRTIVSASLDSTTGNTIVRLTRPLRYFHQGKRMCFSNAQGTESCIDEHAEVQLLTRNIVIEGDETSWENNIGAQVLMRPLRNNAHTYARITYTEIRTCGQKFGLHRYPLYHQGTVAATQSWYIGNSIHDSMNRGIVLNGAMQLKVEDNVLFDTMGHSFYLETGVEMKNVIRRNVVIKSRPCSSCMNSDLTPANFYIANINNYIEGNVAAGSLYHGFWIALSFSVTFRGIYGGTPSNVYWHLRPARQPMTWGAFAGNTAHSCGNNGLGIEPSYEPRRNSWGHGGHHQLVTIRNFTSFKNQVHGVDMGHRAGSVTFDGLKVADTGLEARESSGFWTRHVSAGNMTFGVQNSHFFAFTENRPFRRHAKRSGINLPLSDNWFATNVTFVNYVDENWATEPYRRQSRSHLVYEWGWQYTFESIRWINSAHKCNLRFPHHAIIYDMDGTFLSSNAGDVEHHSQIVPQADIFSVYSCTSIPLGVFPSQASWPVLRCNHDYKIRRIGLNRIYDGGMDQEWFIQGRSEVVPNLGGRTVMTAPINREVTVKFLAFENSIRWDIVYSTRFFLPTEKMLFKTLYREYRWSVNASFNHGEYFKYALPSDANPPTLSDAASASHWSNDTRYNTFLLARPQWRAHVHAYLCPPEGCLAPAAPPAVDKPCESFGLPGTWVSRTTAPGPNEDIHITYQDVVCLDSTTPGWPHNIHFSSLLIEGRLHLFESFCSSTTTIKIHVERFVHIRGGELLFGQELEKLEKCNVEIIMAEVSLLDMTQRTRQHLGPWGTRSFALEFGTLGLHGVDKTPKAYLTKSTIASQADATLHLDRAVSGWKVGDIVGVSGTARGLMYSDDGGRPQESEKRRILTIDATNTIITLSQALTFDKVGDHHDQVLNGSVHINIGAEVVLLSRAITMHGGHANNNVPYFWGWQLNIGCSKLVHEGCGGGDSNGFPMSGQRPGVVQIEGVAFIDIGQRGRLHGAIEIDGLRVDGRTHNYIRNTATLHAMNTAFNLRHSSDALEVSNNVVFEVFGDGFRVASSDNTILGNTAVKGHASGMCGGAYIRHPLTRHVVETCRPAMFRITINNIVKNNTAASGLGAGFITEGDDCDSVIRWSGNVARSVRDGLLVFDYPADKHFKWPTHVFTCRRAGGVTAFSTADTGIAIWYAIGTVLVTDVNVIDTPLGVTSIIVDSGPRDRGFREPQFFITNARFQSHFAGYSCRGGHYKYTCRSSPRGSQHWCRLFEATAPVMGNIAIVESVFVTPQYTGRTIGERYFRWMEPDSYTTLRGKARFNHVFFNGFDGNDSCERKNVAFHPNFMSNDTFHQHIFSNVRWGSSMVNGGELHAKTTYGFISNFRDGRDIRYNDFNEPHYGGYWVDAPNKMWIVDLDGSFTSRQVPNSAHGVRRHILSSQTITRTSTWTSVGGFSGVNDVNAIGSVRSGCDFTTSWNAFICADSFEYLALVIEDVDTDALTRRSAPLVLCKGDGMIDSNGDPKCQGGIVDFASGPVFKGARHRTILERMARYRFIVENGGNYTLLFRGTPPKRVRYMLTDYEYLQKPNRVGIVLNTRIWGDQAHSRMAVFVNGRKQFPSFGYDYPTHWPAPLDAPGTHYHDRFNDGTIHRNVMSFTMRPAAILTLRHENNVQVSLTLAISLESFFDQKDLFIAAFIQVLGIPANSVRFAKIVPGTAGRHFRAQSTSTTTVLLEIANAVETEEDDQLSATETATLAEEAENLDTAALSSSFNNVAVVGAVTSTAVIAEPEASASPVVVADGIAYVQAEAHLPAGMSFSEDDMNAVFVNFVASAAPRESLLGAQEGDVFVANVYTNTSDNVTRFTVQCAFVDLVFDGDNTACVEFLYEAMSNGSFAPSPYSFQDISYNMNGAPSSTTAAPTPQPPTTTAATTTAAPPVTATTVAPTTVAVTPAPSTTTSAPGATPSPVVATSAPGPAATPSPSATPSIGTSAPIVGTPTPTSQGTATPQPQVLSTPVPTTDSGPNPLPTPIPTDAPKTAAPVELNITAPAPPPTTPTPTVPPTPSPTDARSPDTDGRTTVEEVAAGNGDAKDILIISTVVPVVLLFAILAALYYLWFTTRSKDLSYEPPTYIPSCIRNAILKRHEKLRNQRRDTYAGANMEEGKAGSVKADDDNELNGASPKAAAGTEELLCLQSCSAIDIGVGAAADEGVSTSHNGKAVKQYEDHPAFLIDSNNELTKYKDSKRATSLETSYGASRAPGIAASPEASIRIVGSPTTANNIVRASSRNGQATMESGSQKNSPNSSTSSADHPQLATKNTMPLLAPTTDAKSTAPPSLGVSAVGSGLLHHSQQNQSVRSKSAASDTSKRSAEDGRKHSTSQIVEDLESSKYVGVTVLPAPKLDLSAGKFEKELDEDDLVALAGIENTTVSGVAEDLEVKSHDELSIEDESAAVADPTATPPSPSSNNNSIVIHNNVPHQQQQHSNASGSASDDCSLMDVELTE